MIRHLKVGFIGTGNMGEAMIRGLVDSEVISPGSIFASNRSERRLQKVAERYGIQGMPNNEQVVEAADVIVLATKPQDLIPAAESLNSLFRDQQVIVSLAAGLTTQSLQKVIHKGRVVRLMPNSPTRIRRGVLGYCMSQQDDAVDAIIEDLFSPLGYVVKLEEGEEFDSLIVSCGSGTGFVFELMQYWQEWIEERGIDPAIARQMTVETFLGASMLAAEDPDQSLGDLLNKVTSKKGVTAAGLQSMQELELERGLRYSFEKAALRNRELGKS